MASWNLYFLLKLYLYFRDLAAPVWWANLLFILVLILPIRQRWIRVLRAVIGLVVAVALLYYESFLPPFAHLVEQFGNLMNFEPRYLLELIGRFVPLRIALIGAAAVVAYYIVNRWVRVSSVVLTAFLVLPLWAFVNTRMQALTSNLGSTVVAATTLPTAPEARPLMVADGDYDGFLARFRQTEAGRKVIFKPAIEDDRFDIILVHICSLAWDDLKVAKALDNPLLSQFDYLFTNFSGVVSYSGPAAIRLLRANCGQSPNADLYKPASPDCYLLSALREHGYTPQVALNHDGRFDDFVGDVTRNTGVPGVRAMSLEGVPVAMSAFDGSPVRDDLATLRNWWGARQSVQGPVALYYNTITAHDGNHLPGSNLSSLQSYPLRITKLMNEIGQFADVIQASGRKAVLVFIPEHGAALAGDADQIAGLRDIPTPDIIHVPVGVRLINFSGERGATRVIEQPSSYLALDQLLANMVADSPFRSGAPPLSAYSTGLPETAMVGENEGVVTLKTPAGYAMRDVSGNWVERQ